MNSIPESRPAEPAITGRERRIEVVPTIERVDVSLHGHRVYFNI
jgi:hypothetical protein